MSTAKWLSGFLIVVMFAAASAGKAPRRVAPGASSVPDRDQNSRRSGARSVTIPVTIKLADKDSKAELRPVDLIVREDGEAQNILSVRTRVDAPLAVAVLIQDDLVPSVGNEMGAMADFIRHLPSGSRVFIGYIRSGSLQTHQKFTTDLARAAAALRPPTGFASVAPYNPYVEIREGLHRFEGLPAGRRAVLVISDGLDVSRGLDTTSIIQSLDLDQAITEAQRRSVAIYSIYAPTATLGNRGASIATYGQGALERLSNETGGQAFFQGTGKPVSFNPFLAQIDFSLTRQIALTYLSTHRNKGFHKIKVDVDEPSVKITYPSGYTR